MPDKYDEAAHRHFVDAERLAQAYRYDNAGHLIGFAAECAIKWAVMSLGQGTQKLHLPDLVGNAKKHLKGLGSRTLFQVINDRNFFKNWAVRRRYDPDGETTALEYSAWRTSASRAMGAARLRRTA